MTDFASVLTGLDVSVRDNLCDDAAYVASGGTPVPGYRVIVDEASDAVVLRGTSVILGKTYLEVEVAAVPGLKKGDAFDVGTIRWRLAEAPRRPDDGRWWRAAVEKVAQA